MASRQAVEIRLFGMLDVRVDGASQHIGVSGATRSLLQYLICNHSRQSRREALVELFWPDALPERRRSSLNSAIWRIKKALAPFPALGVEATADSVRLTGADGPDVTIDADRVEAAYRAALDAADPAEIEVTPLLDALKDCDAPPLDGLEEDWAGVERERLDALRMRAMTAVMRAFAERRAYDDALEIGRRILQIDPYRECAFQEVMCLYVLNGERARAMQVFEEFSSNLDRELGITPMAETMFLREYLASDQCRNPGKDEVIAQSVLEYTSRPGISGLLCSIEHSRLALHQTMVGAVH